MYLNFSLADSESVGSPVPLDLERAADFLLLDRSAVHTRVVSEGENESELNTSVKDIITKGIEIDVNSYHRYKNLCGSS